MPSSPNIFIVSGGVGNSAEQLVNTVLAQFPDAPVQVTILGSVRQRSQVLEALARAQAANGLIVHTLVDTPLRQVLLEEAGRLGVPTADLTGPLIGWLSLALGRQPVGRPGLYRQLHRQHYERVAAIDYTLAHDDGKRPAGWPQADLMLLGVSRVGKTPLSTYLAVLGWKVANYPLVPLIPVPDDLFKLDPRRVFGLTIDLSQLINYRLQRQAHLGVPGASGYVDPDEIEDELREAQKVFRQGGFQMLDMTDKTIEMAADEIQRQVAPR
jgi:[pyruvate, water dikinase]-phosphate phosphotransferase / [pyruvate, water dikinase] kinase